MLHDPWAVAHRMTRLGVWVAAIALWMPGAAGAQAHDAGATLDQVFARMYNVDFHGAHALLDQHVRADPANPLTHSVRAVAYSFSEMHRLRILETEFFLDDKKVTGTAPLSPDPDVRVRLLAAVEDARRSAQARLQARPQDRDALFALCMSASVVADYTALVERRQLRGLRMGREAQTYAGQLLALTPPAYDAHHVLGVLEYINSRVPFFVRWFVRFKQIEGSEKRAIEHLQIVVDRGRYYGPFAKVLLAVLHLRADRLVDARTLLADLTRQFPENPLFPRELAHVDRLLAARH